MDVVNEEPVTLTEVSQILKKKEKMYNDYGLELRYEQRRAMDHASKFQVVGKKDVDQMKKKLAELELNLNPERIVKIIDQMPKNVDDIRAIFAKERFKYSEEELKSITDIIDQYR